MISSSTQSKGEDRRLVGNFLSRGGPSSNGHNSFMNLSPNNNDILPAVGEFDLSELKYVQQD